MKNIEIDPRTKQDQKRDNSSDDTDDDKELGSDEEQRHSARNYKGGPDGIEGPNYDQYSEGEDGDTSVNAGIFK